MVMSEKTLTKTDFTYLSQKPGVQLIKAGTYQKKQLNAMLQIPALKSQIVLLMCRLAENKHETKGP